MEMFVIEDAGEVRRALADRRGEYLVWPDSAIPFLSQRNLAQHPNRIAIETLLTRAEAGDDAAIAALWSDAEVLSLTLRAPHVS